MSYYLQLLKDAFIGEKNKPIPSVKMFFSSVQDN